MITLLALLVAALLVVAGPLSMMINRHMATTVAGESRFIFVRVAVQLHPSVSPPTETVDPRFFGGTSSIH